MSWPLAALVEGVKMGCGSSSLSRRPAGQADAADLARLAVLLPAGAGQIAARHALDVHAAGLGHQHRAAEEVRRDGERHALDLRAVDQAAEVVGDDVARELEPEGGELGEDGPLVGDAVGQDDVEGGDAVGGHHEEVVAQVVGIAHLAAMEQGRAGEGSLHENGHGYVLPC